MNREKEFYEALGQVPELPQGLYEGIAVRIRKQKLFLRTAYATAATVILALGATGFFLANQTRHSDVPLEVASELQTINDYLNGNDLTKELQVYAVYYNEEY